MQTPHRKGPFLEWNRRLRTTAASYYFFYFNTNSVVGRTSSVNWEWMWWFPLVLTPSLCSLTRTNQQIQTKAMALLMALLQTAGNSDRQVPRISFSRSLLLSSVFFFFVCVFLTSFFFSSGYVNVPQKRQCVCLILFLNVSKAQLQSILKWWHSWSAIDGITLNSLEQWCFSFSDLFHSSQTHL